MIIVSGSMRSGTSLWMQALIAAGLPHIGDAFPADWGGRARPANPRGFYESQLVAGIYFATNPHPATGAFLAPSATRRHVVKVFVTGLIRSDLAYVDHVVATVRPWRTWARSTRAFSAYFPEVQTPSVCPSWLWWMETFALVRDIAIRGYPAHVVAYERVLGDPERELARVLGWLGGGDVQAAVAAVDPALRRSQADEALSPELSPSQERVLDDLYGAIHDERPIGPRLLERMNALDQQLRPRLDKVRQSQRESLLSHFERT